MARFVASAPNHRLLPTLGVAEVAFAGRSNVGKSSLLGLLLAEPKLVRTSRTPGRTQGLNLFLFEEKLAVVDMPGYGYAKLSKTQRASLQHMIRGYLLEREGLCGVALLVDARRDEGVPADVAMARMIVDAGRSLLLVITKADLVPKTRRLHVIRAIEERFGIPRDCAVVCSAKTGEGRDELVRSMLQLTVAETTSQ